MTNFVEKAARYYRMKGGIALLKRALPYFYDRMIRPHLPRFTATYNNTQVKVNHLGDSFLPWHPVDKPGYESALVEGLQSRVREGDHVVVVGGGYGVTAVNAARQVGEDGRVTVYEAAERLIDAIEETLELNDVTDRVDVHHALVGPSVEVLGDSTTAVHLSPEDLPECDVLELDCEGAEIDILSNLQIRPRVILVESHGEFDAPTDEVASLLEDLSYSVESQEVADEWVREKCIENDVYVLTGVRDKA
ncbi:FkbM family methyltransferase [Halorussus limi]|uniref:FkbM family methyltransferase n=1 Tax=Halorussus limi TaxID=2938695 RepID=A0A8U0HX04_9EURY|nr:FkbM family methyltransferase [Halorussus limi]UPV75251.1 FkbM family methyltransferase [Halorussus limi]